MHAARDEIIASTFGRRFAEERRLDFKETLRTQFFANGPNDLMPKRKSGLSLP